MTKPDMNILWSYPNPTLLLTEEYDEQEPTAMLWLKYNLKNWNNKLEQGLYFILFCLKLVSLTLLLRKCLHNYQL